MLIGIRGGHNEVVPGAHAILDEVTEDRKYSKSIMNYLRMAGHEVIDCTPGRTSTSAEDLNYGVNKANASKVDLFVSCHLNAGMGKGCEVIYSSTKGKTYADKVVNSIASLGFTNRGSKLDSRGLYELKHTNMPAIIIEPCFVDTQSDVDLYNKVGYDKIGKSIAEGIISLIGSKEVPKVNDNDVMPTGDNITPLNGGGWVERVSDGRTIIHQSRSVYLALTADGHLNFTANGTTTKLV